MAHSALVCVLGVSTSFVPLRKRVICVVLQRPTELPDISGIIGASVSAAVVVALVVTALACKFWVCRCRGPQAGATIPRYHKATTVSHRQVKKSAYNRVNIRDLEVYVDSEDEGEELGVVDSDDESQDSIDRQERLETAFDRQLRAAAAMQSPTQQRRQNVASPQYGVEV